MEIEYKMETRTVNNNMEVWKHKETEEEVFFVTAAGQLICVDLKNNHVSRMVRESYILQNYEYVGLITKMEVTCLS